MSRADRSTTGNYLAALTNPFSDEAIGARVPDQWAFPTATYRSRGTVTMTSDASGVASGTFFCNPYVSFAANDTNISTGMQPHTSSPLIYAAASQANITNVLASVRVVGGGLSIRANLPLTTDTGRIIVARVPVNSPGLGPALLDLNVVSPEAVCQMTIGMDTGGANTAWPADILELPGSQELTVQDIIAQSLELHFKPITPMAFNFLDTSNATQINATDRSGVGNVKTATSLAFVTDNAGEQDMRGWDAFLIRCEGLPVSTQACIEVEYIYHYEGNPAMVTTQGNLEPDCPPRTVVDIPGFQVAVSKALSAPSMIQTVRDIGSSIINKGTAAMSMMAKLGLSL